ncbi:MAG: peptidase M4, partial [Clostridia bacterium]|nr:peptidase M4 [Clostridia bacterium]
DAFIHSKILTEAEKAPGSEIKREDAFQYVVRLAGFEKIASLKDIYKVNYADGALLSPEKLGHAAILSGLGVICGDGGNLRPQDLVTNAEAIVLTYKYLLSF